MDKLEMLTALKQAQGFIGARAKMAGVGDGHMLLLSWFKALELAIHELSVDAAPVRHGHWIYKRSCWAECSECHHDFNDVYDLENSDNYCRHCGAKMDGDAKCP